jgi:hypothetical protein
LGISTLLVSTGKLVYHCPIPIITLNFKGDAIYTSTCLLNLNQCIDSAGSSNLLDLILSNLSDLSVAPVDPGLIKPDNYHPHLITNICLPIATCVQNYVYSYRKFSSGDYALLYNTLSTYDWSCVYDTTYVDSAVTCLNAAVEDATEQAIPCGILNSNSKFQQWYSSSLKYYISKKNYFYRRLEKKNSLFNKNFLSTVSWLRLLLSLTDSDG